MFFTHAFRDYTLRLLNDFKFLTIYIAKFKGFPLTEREFLKEFNTVETI